MEEIKELLLQHPHKHQDLEEVIPTTAMSPRSPSIAPDCPHLQGHLAPS